MLREQAGALLVEVLATVLIVVMVLVGAAFAIAQVGAGQRFADTMLTASTQLQVAGNMIGEDVSHGTVISLEPNASSWNPELDDPAQGHPASWRLMVSQDEHRNVTYIVQKEKPGQDDWTLYRSDGVSTLPVLAGLVPGMTGFKQDTTSGGVSVVLTVNVPYGKNKRTFTIKSFFHPRGGI